MNHGIELEQPQTVIMTPEEFEEQARHEGEATIRAARISLRQS